MGRSHKLHPSLCTQCGQVLVTQLGATAESQGCKEWSVNGSPLALKTHLCFPTPFSISREQMEPRSTLMGWAGETRVAPICVGDWAMEDAWGPLLALGNRPSVGLSSDHTPYH